MTRQLCQLLPTLRTHCVLAVLLAYGATLLPAATYGVDPVEELRAALRVKVRDSANADELRFRKELLEKRIKALRVGDYRRALSLIDWRDRDPDPAVAAVDSGVRQQLIELLADRLRALLKSGSTPTKLAAITEIAEIPMNIRAGNVPDNLKLTEEERLAWGRGGLGRQFGPDLIALLKDRDSTVRQFAARALGRINPDPQPATKALGALLADGSVPERRAAADGLLRMLQMLLAVIKGQSPDIVPADLALADRWVVATAGRGVADTNALVRQTCLEAIRLGARALHDPPLLVDIPEAQRAEFPPPGRARTEAENLQIKQVRDELEAERRRALPVAEALAAQVKLVLPAVNDAVPEVRLAACQTLEEMGEVRMRMARRLANVPLLEPEPLKKEARRQRPQQAAVLVAFLPVAQAGDKDLLTADPLNRPLQGTLTTLATRAVKDPRPRIRLAAVDAIEPLARDAAPVLPILAYTLQDGNNFVRWSGARVVGKIGPVDTELTLPLLVRLLSDEDLDVELAAATALQLYGSDAAAAVPALTTAVGAGDVERRVAAIHALEAIGPEAQPAIPMLTNVLAHKDARVRRAAAEGLGKFGPAARSAIAALEPLLTDVDEEVRRAVADALLAITPGK